MPFVDESPSFVHGFEIGQMWERMKHSEKIKDQLFHTVNTNQVEMMCKRFHYTCTIEKIDDTWSRLSAEVGPTAN